ncbi:MAG: cupin domain-containing protein [Hyphomicrobiales bacterium]
MSSLGKCIAVLCSAIFAGLLVVAEPLAREDVAPKVEAQHLLTAPLAGEPGKEVDIEIYTFPPGASVPWHIHPDAHEFDYELEGTLTLEVKGEPPRDLKAGEAFYLPPNVVHRGENRSATQPAKVYVVRVKPVGKPLTELINPGNGGYPDAGSQD